MDIERIETLIAERKKIDAELVALVTYGAKPKERKPQACSRCGEVGHSARTCTTEQKES